MVTIPSDTHPDYGNTKPYRQYSHYALTIFGIKYTNLNHAHHLINTLQKYYKISTDWSGADYCGLHLEWNYSQRYVYVSMPAYICPFYPSDAPTQQHR